MSDPDRAARAPHRIKTQELHLYREKFAAVARLPLFILGTMVMITAARPQTVSLMYHDLAFIAGGVLLVGGLALALPGIGIIGQDRSNTSMTEPNNVTSKVFVRPVGPGSEPLPAARRFITVGPTGVSGAF